MKEAGIEIVLTPRRIHEQSLTFSFPTSNNEAKYEAVLVGLRAAITLGVTGLEDSSLIVNQVIEGVHRKRSLDG